MRWRGRLVMLNPTGCAAVQGELAQISSKFGIFAFYRRNSAA